jgi:hypothetical protein
MEGTNAPHCCAILIFISEIRQSPITHQQQIGFARLGHQTATAMAKIAAICKSTP